MNRVSLGLVALALQWGPLVANAALISADGGLVVDDPDANLMWSSNVAGVLASPSAAQTWISGLNASDYGGYNDWRLPTTVDSYPASAGTNPDQSSSEMAHLFYGELGQISGSQITAVHSADYSLFSGLSDNVFWSGTVYSANPAYQWAFDPNNGSQYYVPANGGASAALAVRSLNPVPLPASAWLLLSGLGGLGFAGWRRRATQ